MKNETLSIHFGYETDPTTKSVATPIYQTVAHEFDDAQHGADLFNLAVAGQYLHSYNEPNQRCATEKRMAALEGGIAGLVVSAGSATWINYAIQTWRRSVTTSFQHLQLYGGTYTPICAHATKPRHKFALPKTTSLKTAALIDEKTKAVYLESIGNPAR
ncbi:PLP-dependent transferase [Vibrio lentus]|nr:PLP-dependent transferase [Vibrio lentus]